MSAQRIEFLSTGITNVTSDSIVSDVYQLLSDLYRIGLSLGLLSESAAVSKQVKTTSDMMRSAETAPLGLMQLSDIVAHSIHNSRKDRKKVSSLYDLAKHLQSFHKLLANDTIQTRLREVLATDSIFMHKDSVGMRIDLPNETEQLTNIHQEFHSFPFGVNGAVVWIPLTKIDSYRGTLNYYPRPHRSAPMPFKGDHSEEARLLEGGALQLAQKVGALDCSEGDLGAGSLLRAEPGTCYIFSCLMPHSSVVAESVCEYARLTCQARFYDFEDPFFQWKHREGRFWEGMKAPSIGYRLWTEYCDR